MVVIVAIPWLGWDGAVSVTRHDCSIRSAEYEPLKPLLIRPSTQSAPRCHYQVGLFVLGRVKRANGQLLHD